MDFPATPAQPTARLETLESALDATVRYIGRSRFDYLVEVENEDIVRTMKPDFAALRQFKVRGVIVTSRSSSSEYDFISRFFARIGYRRGPRHRLGSSLFRSVLAGAIG